MICLIHLFETRDETIQMAQKGQKEIEIQLSSRTNYSIYGNSWANKIVSYINFRNFHTVFLVHQARFRPKNAFAIFFSFFIHFRVSFDSPLSIPLEVTKMKQKKCIELSFGRLEFKYLFVDNTNPHKNPGLQRD